MGGRGGGGGGGGGRSRGKRKGNGGRNSPSKSRAAESPKKKEEEFKLETLSGMVGKVRMDWELRMGGAKRGQELKGGSSEAT